VAVDGRDVSWERILLVEGQPWANANDLSLELEGISSGSCGHGSCLVPVSLEEWSPLGWQEWL